MQSSGGLQEKFSGFTGFRSVMRLHEILVETRGSTTSLIGRVERRNGERFDLYFGFAGALPGPIEARADAFVPALLIPAMLAGEPLECDIPVSPRLLASVPRAQAVLAGWYPRFHPVPVAIPAAATVRSQRVERTAAFFSAGVDSFHTLLKNRHGRGTTGTVSHVVFMKGFDAQLAQADGLAESEAHVRGIAGRLGVGLIVGRVQCARPRARALAGGVSRCGAGRGRTGARG